MTALVGHLAKMTRVGVLAPGSDGTAEVVARLGDERRIRDSRLHPIALLSALRTYAAGRPMRGRQRWAPVPEVVDALDAAFSTAFGNVEPTGQRLLLALDVSGSMAWGDVAGVPGSPARRVGGDGARDRGDRAAARDRRVLRRRMVPRPRSQRYDGLPDGSRASRSRRAGLHDAIRAVDDLPFGATDCALPMLYAQALERDVDTFVVYTDSEVRPGDVHPVQALREYRAATGIDARLVVVGMASTGFSIADPADAGMLDVLGFDPATPQLIADFARRAL